MKRTKVYKHKKWLESHNFYVKSYGNKVLFINDKARFDRLTPVFYINVNERAVYERGVSSFLYFFMYRRNIDLYCIHRYGWKPKWKNWKLEDIYSEKFFPIGWGGTK